MPYLKHYPSPEQPRVGVNIWILMTYKKLLWKNLLGDISRAALLAKLSRLPNLWVICRLPETKWQIAILR